MTILTPTNAFPGMAMPQHLSGGSSTATNYRYPAAVQPKKQISLQVLSYVNAFPAIPFPNHLTGKATPNSYIFPGALQPIVPPLPNFVPLQGVIGFVEIDW